MKRRRVWRTVISILIGATLIVGGGLIALQLTSPTAPILDSPLADSASPQEWLDAPVEEIPSSEEESSPEAPDAARSFRSTGQLAIIANGERIGSESYAIRVEGEQIDLESVGQFEFRVVIATMRAAFMQSMQIIERAPTSYTYELDAPLGRSAVIEASEEGKVFRVSRNGETTRIPIPNEGALVLGSFASYAVLPPLLGDLAVGDHWASAVFVLGGRPGSQEPQGEALQTLRIVRGQDERIRLGESLVAIEAYHVDSPSGGATLYAKGAELLAFIAQGENGNLRISREDIFPDGFEVEGKAEL